MTKLFTLLLVAVPILLLAPTEAQGGIGVFATWWNGKDIDNGVGLGAKYDINFIPLIGVDVRGSYVSFGEADMSVIPLEAVGALDLGLLYGGVSVGYYIWNAKDVSADNGTGGSVFAGLKLRLFGIGPFGELRYNLAETRIEDISTEKANGFSINLGVSFGGGREF